LLIASTDGCTLVLHGKEDEAGNFLRLASREAGDLLMYRSTYSSLSRE
jgi:hypothetical protein